MYLSGPFNEQLSASIVAQLLFLEADNPEKAISLYINSPGGSVTAGELCSTRRLMVLVNWRPAIPMLSCVLSSNVGSLAVVVKFNPPVHGVLEALIFRIATNLRYLDFSISKRQVISSSQS